MFLLVLLDSRSVAEVFEVGFETASKLFGNIGSTLGTRSRLLVLPVSFFAMVERSHAIVSLGLFHPLTGSFADWTMSHRRFCET